MLAVLPGASKKCALLFLAVLAAHDLGHASAQNVTKPQPDPQSPSLSIEQFVTYLQTEVGEEFGLDVDANAAAEHWNNAVYFEWERCLLEEQLLDGQQCEFILCSKGGAAGQSGHARQQALKGAVDEAMGKDGEGVEFQTIYSDAEEGNWCGFARMRASVAEQISCDEDECFVTPVIMSMRMMPKLVGRLTDELEALYEGGENATEFFPTADIALCPGVISQNVVDEMDNKDGTDASEMDITETITAWILSKQESAGSVKSNVMEGSYWSKEDMARERTARGKFWDEVFRLALLTDLCVETYTTRLMWSADYLSANDFSTLSVTFNNTNIELIDQKCVTALMGALALRLDVCSIDIQPRFKVLNRNAQWIMQSGVEEERPWSDVGLDGAGQVVAVSDTGIDQNNCYFWDSTKGRAGSIRDDSHRKVVEYLPFVALDDYPFVDMDDYLYGHGTHVVGTVAGRKAKLGTDETSGVADGLATGAKIAFADIGDEDGNLFVPPVQTLLSTGRDVTSDEQPIAHVHSASWGGFSNNYDFQARNFDAFIFDNDDLLMNVAAGNSGKSLFLYDRSNTVGTPATLKNGIAVGSSQSAKDDLQLGQLGQDYVSDFSSRGPTADGRIKPEVVAPGHFILSAGARPDQVGECDATDKDPIPPPGMPREGLLSIAGTSMATPATSGVASLIQQYFEEGWYPGGTKGSGEKMMPSAALVKAVILNGAQTDVMKGVDNGSNGVTPVSAYDNTIGFGRVTLSTSLHIEGKNEVQAKVWDREIISGGDVKQFQLSIDKSNGCTFSSLSATLVWVERPGVLGCSKCVLNDLDLHVTKNDDATKYFPNGLNGRDDINNAERVVIKNVDDGDVFILHVTAFNLDSLTQKFALVATGCFGGAGILKDDSSSSPTSSPEAAPTGAPSGGHSITSSWSWLLYLFAGFIGIRLI